MRISTLLVPLALLPAACSSDGPDAADDDVDAAGPPGCGDGDLDPGEECDDGNHAGFDGCLPDCTAVEPMSAPAGEWTYVEIPGTRCLDGSVAGFSVNPSAGSKDLVIYLEGGGACFNDFCESIFTPGGPTPGPSGIFDRAAAGNPVADWNLVYVPYCSGDVYGGDRESTVAGELRQFRGYRNVTAFLERWAFWFADAEQVMLTGSSAGGFGAAINYPQAQEAFDVPVTLIDDSGPPLGRDVFPPCLQAIFRDTWGLDETLLVECGDDCASDDFIAGYFEHLRAKFPSMRGGLYSSLQDRTIRSFAGYGWTNGYDQCGQFPTTVEGPVFEEALLTLRDGLPGDGSFGTYYVTGTSHTVLRSDRLYDDETGGLTAAAWITAALQGETSHVGP